MQPRVLEVVIKKGAKSSKINLQYDVNMMIVVRALQI